MYKIYFSDSLLILSDEPVEKAHAKFSDEQVVMPYTGKRKSLFQYIDLLEKTTKRKYCINIYDPDIEALWENFQSIFKLAPAAGGVVKEPGGRIAAIFRRGYWDLPKGKLDKGEDFKDAALREVEEEVGLKNLELERFLGATWHTYTQKDKRVLKETQWYLMRSPQQELVPQADEQIEDAIWVDPREFLDRYAPQYLSLYQFLGEIIPAI